MTLPPLPEPLIVYEDWSIGGVYVEGWTDDQTRAYATAAVLQEREACAKLCETLGGASSAWHAEAIRARTEP